MAELTKKQLMQLEQQLLLLKHEMESLVMAEQSASETVSLDQSRLGRLSRMDAMQQQAMAKAEQQRVQKRLHQVTQALKKIKQKDFGFCIQCGGLIAFQRLLIKPESTLCIQCQERAEQ